MLFCMAKNLAFPEILTIAFNSGMYLQVSAVYLLWNAIQTKQLYGERETVPPIHPRYGNLCKEQDEGGEEAGGSFYMRLVICILCFIFFVYMDQNHAEVANVNSTKIINEIERDVELEVWENFE